MRKICQLRRDNYKIIAEDVNEVYKDSGLGDWFGKGGGGGKEEGGWDRYNTAGERIGKCGDARKVQPIQPVFPQRKPSNSEKKVSQILSSVNGLHKRKQETKPKVASRKKDKSQ